MDVSGALSFPRDAALLDRALAASTKAENVKYVLLHVHSLHKLIGSPFLAFTDPVGRCLAISYLCLLSCCCKAFSMDAPATMRVCVCACVCALQLALHCHTCACVMSVIVLERFL